MTIAAALLRGIQSLKWEKSLWLWFYGIATIWALAIVAPVMALVYASLGHSAWSEQMAANFDLQWVAELLFEKSVLASTPMAAAMLAIAAVSAIVHLFLLGGALQLFWTREEFSTAAFFEGCGRHFWRFIRLALLSAVFCAAVLLVNSVLARTGKKLWGEGSEETPLVYWNWFRVAAVLLLFGLVNLISDYARIRLVATDSPDAFREALFAARFVFANFGKTAGLYAALWAMLIVLLAAYRGVEAIIGQASLSLIALLFVVRQITVLARIWVQLLFYSSQAEMFRANLPEPPPSNPL